MTNHRTSGQRLTSVELLKGIRSSTQAAPEDFGLAATVLPESAEWYAEALGACEDVGISPSLRFFGFVLARDLPFLTSPSQAQYERVIDLSVARAPDFLKAGWHLNHRPLYGSDSSQPRTQRSSLNPPNLP